jgi:predicted nucleotidyltransferase
MMVFEGYAKYVVYDEKRWDLLRRKRELALKLMHVLERCSIVRYSCSWERG